MSYLAYIKLILSLLPLILEVVSAIEKSLPQSGQGAAKLALVKNAIQAAYDASKDATAKFDEIWPTIQKVVESTVALFNTTGKFLKK